jgi:uncharacterized protein (DUF1697 family)
MNQNDPQFTSDIRAQLEKHGAAQVRTLIQSGNWPTNLTPIALEWLKEKDQEAERLTAASQSEMADAASRAATAAERAAAAAEAQARTARHALITAIAATLIAAIALIVSIFGALHFFG